MGFQCINCGKEFEHKNDFRRHLIKKELGTDQVSVIAENIINQQQKIGKLEQELKELKSILQQY